MLSTNATRASLSKTGCRFNIECRLRSLLLCLEPLGLGRKTIIDPRLHRLLDRLRGFERASRYQNFLARSSELIEPLGYLENNLLMRRVEANIRHHQLFFGRRDHGASFAEIE